MPLNRMTKLKASQQGDLLAIQQESRRQQHAEARAKGDDRLAYPREIQLQIQEPAGEQQGR